MRVMGSGSQPLPSKTGQQVGRTMGGGARLAGLRCLRSTWPCCEGQFAFADISVGRPGASHRVLRRQRHICATRPASPEVEVRIQAPERDGGACARAMSIFRVARFFKSFGSFIFQFGGDGIGRHPCSQPPCRALKGARVMC